MPTDTYQTYLQLVERVDRFAKLVHERYPGQITCHAGCDGCCYQQFTIFLIEAEHLAQTLATFSPAARRRLRERLTAQADLLPMADEPQPCSLLHEGRCAVYAGRPLICRMHGYPLFSDMIERPDGSKRDCCPLNFSDVPLQNVESHVVFNLDLVNQTLAAINHAFTEEQGIADQRLTIKQAVLRALQEDEPL